MGKDIRELTGGEVAGAGAFDELMRTVKAHIQDQFDNDYIVGADYTQVYLQSLQAVLAVSSQYTLQSDIVAQQVELLKEQVIQSKKQTLLLDKQLESAQLNIDTQTYNLQNILPAQYLQLQAQTIQLQEQTVLTTAQIATAGAQLLVVGKQEDLLDKQILTETASTTTPTAGLTYTAYQKQLAEIEILDQRLITETAQTSGDFNSVGGLLGAEMSLKDIQKESFLRDAEQKAAKMWTDVYATLYATDPDDPNVVPEDYGFDGVTAKAVLSKLSQGIGAPPIF